MEKPLNYVEIKPGRERSKTLIVRLIFLIFVRSLQSLSRFDPVVKKELLNWSNNYSIMYKVQPNGPRISIANVNGILKKVNLKEQEVDMIVYIKNITSAFLLMSSRISSIQAFMEHRAYIKGDVRMAKSLLRILDRMMTYLYPRFITKRIVKRIPSIPWYQRYRRRIRIYLLGIPFGY